VAPGRRWAEQATALGRQEELRAAVIQVAADEFLAAAVVDGRTLVKITEDLSRSGKVSAFDRPQLGPWLTQPARIAKWDILITTKLNRACRDAFDFLRLRKWCEEHGKIYVSLAENIDLSTSAGRYNATQWAAAAEFERERASEQRLETLAELDEQGRWKGGRLGYGMRAVKTEDGYYLAPDDGGTAEIARKMAQMAISGKSNGQIAEWLNAKGHKTMTGSAWRIERVRLVLRSDNMAKILTEDEHAKLRAALRSREQTRGERVGGHMLLRVAYCRQCHGPYYGHLRQGRALRGYYVCHPCGIHIRMDRFEDAVEKALLREAGSRQLVKRELQPGDDWSKDIEKAKQDLDALRALSPSDSLNLVIREREDALDELRHRPHAPDHIVEIPLGVTVAEHWATLDMAGKGQFLREWEVKAEADREGLVLTLGWLAYDSDTFTLDLQRSLARS
jgi:DNA invertase Pin-like site-specific DNA recombinase